MPFDLSFWLDQWVCVLDIGRKMDSPRNQSLKKVEKEKN